MRRAWLQPFSLFLVSLCLTLHVRGGIPTGSPCAGLDSAERATCVEQQASALASAGKEREALDLWGALLVEDDGTVSLEWIRLQSGSGWKAVIDSGDGRIERAALAAVAAGDTARGRDWLARALALGAGDEARRAWNDLGGGAVAGLDPEPTPLTVEPWFRPLPDVEIPIFNHDEPFLISDARGKVLVLDFWASWCAPCAEELPLLQALFDAEEHRGLVAIAVNGLEPPEFALPYARELGLTLPIGRYTDELDKVYLVKSLPTLVVADQKGRVRKRWDGYRKGLEDEVAATVRALLAADGTAAGAEVALQLHGAGLFEVDWSRRLEGRITGLQIVDAPDGRARVLLSLGRTLGVYGRGGMTIRKWDSTSTAALLRRGARDAERNYALYGFRPGGQQLARFAMPQGDYETFESPAPVLDVELPPRSEAPIALVGTTAGLFVHDDGAFRAVDGISQAIDLDVMATTGGPELVLLDEDDSGRRNLRRLNGELAIRDTQRVAGNAFRMVVDSALPEQVGVVPFAVTASASGAFLEPGRRQAALATRSGQLVLIDLDSGKERFRAAWPGVSHLGAGDADGDGLDELFVASGRRIVVLKALK